MGIFHQRRFTVIKGGKDQNAQKIVQCLSILFILKASNTASGTLNTNEVMHDLRIFSMITFCYNIANSLRHSSAEALVQETVAHLVGSGYLEVKRLSLKGRKYLLTQKAKQLFPSGEPEMTVLFESLAPDLNTEECAIIVCATKTALAARRNKVGITDLITTF